MPSYAYPSTSPQFDERSRDWGLWGRPIYEKKGDFRGECQRFACVNRDAQWLNETDGHYYCPTCADAFNEAALRSGQAPPCAPFSDR